MVNRPRREAGAEAGAEVKETWIFAFTPSIRLNGLVYS